MSRGRAASPSPSSAPVVGRFTHSTVDKINAGDTAALQLIADNPEVLSLAAPTVRFALYSACLAMIADSRGVFSSGSGVKQESARAMRALSAVLDSATDAGVELRQLLRESGPEELRRLRLHRHVTSQKDDVCPAALQFIARIMESLRLRPDEFIPEPLSTAVQQGIRDNLELDRGRRGARTRAMSAHGNQRQPSDAAVGGAQQHVDPATLAPTSRPRAATTMGGRAVRNDLRLPSEPSSVPSALNPLFCAPAGDPVASMTAFSLGTLVPPTAVAFFAKHFGFGCVPSLPPADAFRLIQKRASEQLAAREANATPPDGVAADGGAAMPRMQTFATVTSTLLERFLADDGICVGWGTTKYGELGPAALASGAGVTPPITLDLTFPEVRHAGASNHAAIRVTCRPVGAALGHAFSVWLLDNGSVATHGSGEWGQLGIGQLKAGASISMPVSPQHVASRPAHLARYMRSTDTITTVRAGFAYAAAMTTKGDLYLWGNNNHGQCSIGAPLPANADPASTRQMVPLKICLKNCPVVDIAAGSFFVVALTAPGSVLAWGLLSMLGLGTEEQAKELIPSNRISAAVSRDAKVVTTTPARIPGLDRKQIKCIAAGQWHAAAVSASGALYTWGVGHQGRLGHGTTDQEFYPKFVEALKDHRVVKVSCGSFHTAVLTAAGEVWCFGDNAAGQCGNVTKTYYTTPVKPAFPDHESCQCISIGCGREHTVCLLVTGEVWAFGSGAGCGAVGIRPRLYVPRPVVMQHTVLRVDSGMAHVVGLALPRHLALIALGELPGRNGPRVLADSSSAPLTIHSIASGSGFTVIADTAGVVRSVGNGEWGQLGLGDTRRLVAGGANGPTVGASGSTSAVVVPDLTVVETLQGHVVTHVAAGYAFAFALTDTGRVFFWGNNNHGQGALGATGVGKIKIDSPTLVPALSFATTSSGGGPAVGNAADSTVLAVSSPVVQIVAGSFFGIALTADGKVYTWGHPDCCGLAPEEWQHPETITAACRASAEEAVQTFFAALSATDHAPSTPPESGGSNASSPHGSPSSPASAADQLAAARALKPSDVIGVSMTKEARTVIIRPTLVHHLDACIISIAAGQWHAAALTERGAMYVWGLGHGGRLGNASATPSYVPVRIAAPASGPMAAPIASIACGSFNSAAVTATGALYLWGDNEHGQCGFKNPTLATDRPVLVKPSGVRTVALGRHHALASMLDGTLEVAGSLPWPGVPDGIRCSPFAPIATALQGAVPSSGADTSSNTPFATYSAMIAQASNKRGSRAGAASAVPSAVMLSAGGNHACVLVELGRPSTADVVAAADELLRCTNAYANVTPQETSNGGAAALA